VLQFFNQIMETNETIRQLLQQYYNISHPEILPAQRQKSQWENDNKFGFLNGIVEFGKEPHHQKLYELLSHNLFQQEEEFFINEMYDLYILPFKQHNGNGSSCHTPVTSRRNSMVDEDTIEKELSHRNLRKAVSNRDVVCLFCWDKLQLHAAHIVAQKNGLVMDIDERSVFQRAGLTQKHQVQNGLLLCANCHNEFDSLEKYVDIEENRMLVKIVNQSNDENDTEWKRIVKRLKYARKSDEEYWVDVDNRKALDEDCEMRLWFVNKDEDLLPNKIALEMPKTACLIWRMAGGAEPDEEECPDEDDNLSISLNFKTRILNWSSNVTLNNETA